ncbi:MAG: aminoglycoside adenylyltransferase domain-containing protein [Thermotogota bacterium]
MLILNDENAKNILETIEHEYKKILKERLIGLYLHGSLAMGCFHPKISDIDFLVVVNNTLSDKEKRALIQTLIDLDDVKPAKGLEMSVLLLKETQHFTYPTPFILHYGESHKERFIKKGYLCENGKDPDLAAHITVLKNRGKLICGKAIEAVFSNVPKEDYLKALMYDMDDAQALINENPVYFTLNICRTLCYLKEGKILSKVEGGHWGLINLPKRFHKIIQQSLNAYKSGEQNQPFDPEVLKELTDFSQQIKRKEF